MPTRPGRVFQVSLSWLQQFAKQWYKRVPGDLGAIQALDKEKLRWALASIQLDEMYGFLGNKANKQWLFLAYQADTKHIVAAQIGKCNLTTLNKPWRQIPRYLRQHLDFDQYKAYASLIPVNQHFAS